MSTQSAEAYTVSFSLPAETQRRLIMEAVRQRIPPSVTFAEYARVQAQQARKAASQWDLMAKTLDKHPEALTLGKMPRQKSKPVQRETEAQMMMRPYNAYETGPGLPDVKP